MIDQRRLGACARHQLRKLTLRLHRRVADRRRFGQALAAVVAGGIGHGGVAQPRADIEIVVILSVHGVAGEVVQQRIRQAQRDDPALIVALVIRECGQHHVDISHANVLLDLVRLALVLDQRQRLADRRQLGIDALDDVDRLHAGDVILIEHAVPHRSLEQIGLDPVDRIRASIERVVR